MAIKAKAGETYISWTLIDNQLWAVKKYLMPRVGVDQAAQDVAPLNWYIGTGRASVEFMRAFVQAKAYMIGRVLHKGGSYDEAIRRVKEYLCV